SPRDLYKPLLAMVDPSFNLLVQEAKKLVARRAEHKRLDSLKPIKVPFARYQAPQAPPKPRQGLPQLNSTTLYHAYEKRRPAPKTYDVRLASFIARLPTEVIQQILLEVYEWRPIPRNAHGISRQMQQRFWADKPLIVPTGTRVYPLTPLDTEAIRHIRKVSIAFTIQDHKDWDTLLTRLTGYFNPGGMTREHLRNPNSPAWKYFRAIMQDAALGLYCCWISKLDALSDFRQLKELRLDFRECYNFHTLWMGELLVRRSAPFKYGLPDVLEILVPPSMGSVKEQRIREMYSIMNPTVVGNRQNAQIRDRKAIAAVVARHGSTFQPLNKKFGYKVVIDVTLSLLENRIFESELKAKLAFPELYQVSAARSLQHDVSEQNAARSEVEALEAISLADDEDEQELHPDSDDDYKAEDEHTATNATVKISSDTPSLYPVYIMFEVQHKLLNTVQSVLERCCYDWAKRWFPGVLQERKLTCAEAVELTKWVNLIPYAQLPKEATTNNGRTELTQTLKATHELRHAAVHRLTTSAKGTKKMLQNALCLTKALNDSTTGFKIEQLLRDFQGRLEDMELNKNHLENELDEQMREIQRQRAALDQREKDAKTSMVQQDHDTTVKLSRLFEESLTKIMLPDENDPGNTVQPTPADEVLDTTHENLDISAVSSDDKELSDKNIKSGNSSEAETTNANETTQPQLSESGADVGEIAAQEAGLQQSI
ncbi:MAG: hypothetical protein Q9218_004549, partial [Villophora microphyllina]